MEIPEICRLIVLHASLDSMVALSQTSRNMSAILSSDDTSIVRQKVLERVPWMELAPEVGLRSWMDCARLIVARRRSFKEEPEKWWSYNDKNPSLNYTMDELKAHTDITYVEQENIDGRALPESFKPLFGSALSPFKGKLFSSPGGKALDMTTMKLVKPEIKDESRKDESRWRVTEGLFLRGKFEPQGLVKGLWSVKCEHSQIIIGCVTPFHITDYHEEGWVLAEGTFEELDDSKKSYFVKKPENKTYLLFEPDKEICLYREIEPNQVRPTNQFRRSYQFTPNGNGLVCILWVIDDGGIVVCKQSIFYHDLSTKNSRAISLAQFTQEAHHFSVQIYHVVFYAGMMFLNFDYDTYLVPLWVDLEPLQADQTHAFLGNKFVWKTLAYNLDVLRQFTFPTILSSDRRWLTRTGCTVSDLWKCKTYISKNTTVGVKPREILVGAGDEEPTFFTITTSLLMTLDSFLYGKRLCHNGFPTGKNGTDPSKFLARVVETNKLHPPSYKYSELKKYCNRGPCQHVTIVIEPLDAPVGLACLSLDDE
ncbi:hypothetical protein CJU89_3997 [Yarrowia sp. B02]|nr:hypothetical protein CJU89_3997 [Yarrowia sp. B02]